MKKILWIALVLLVLTGGALFAFGDALAEAITQRALVRVGAIARAHGVVWDKVEYDSARFAGLTAIRCDGVSARVDVTRREGAGRRTDTFTVSARHVVISAGWPWSGDARLTVFDGAIEQVTAGSSSGREERLSAIQVDLAFPLSWTEPRQSLAGLESELRGLLHDGSTALSLRLTTTARVTVAGQPFELNIRTDPLPSGGAALAVNRADVERISRHYTLPLTETEIDLVVRYPHRAPTLMRLSERAMRAALAESQRDRSFPADAYRHVYWSWLLTRTYGAAFSEEVTDAHEVGATYEFGEAGQRMDLHNNAVGRAYAMAGVSESELVRRVLTDPAVMRKPPAEKAE